MFKTCAFVAIAFAIMPINAATATDYNFSYTGQNGTAGSGKITTSSTLDAIGGYNITGITGTFGVAVITGLVNDPFRPLPDLIGAYTFDNVLFPNALSVFDQYGIAFSTGATSFNIFNSAADGAVAPKGYPYGLLTSPTSTEKFGKFSVSIPAAVPEPASWAMMIVGMGAVGFAMRNAKRRSDDKFDAKIKKTTFGAVG